MLEFEKFQPPIVRAGLLRRERLETALLSSLDQNALTVIAAPAGSGKSILMSQVMNAYAEGGGRCAWFSCDQFDQDKRRFLSMLTLAVQQKPSAPPSKKHVSESLLSTTDPSGIIRAAIRKGERFTLFFDNFHLCETPETAAILDALVAESAGALHVAVTSRVQPHLTLGHLRLRGLLGEFDAADLAFSEAEASALLTQHDVPGAAKALSRLLERTEGWAAAVQVIRILAEGGADLHTLADNFSGADKDLRDFLNEEVLRTLLPSTQEFLLRTAHLERFSVDLAQYATGLKDAAQSFNDVVERNLFVTALDRRGEWIRLHSVFRDYLVDLSRRRDRENYRSVLARAAHWHAQQSDWPPAIDYAIRAERYDLATAWLAETGEEIVERRGETALYLSCCERIPEQYLSDPTVLFWMVWATFFSSDYDRASILLKTHLKVIQAAPDLASNASLLQFLVALFTHRFREASELGPPWLTANPNATHFNRATVAGGLALTQHAQLQHASALKSIQIGQATIAKADSTYGTGWICVISAILALAGGRVYEARDTLEDYLAAVPSGHRMRETVEVVLSEVYYELDMLPLAQKLSARSIASIARHSIYDTAVSGWRSAALLAAQRGDVDEALRVLADAETIAMRRFGDHVVATLRIVRNEIILLLSVNARRMIENISAAALDVPLERSKLCPLTAERAALIDAQRLLVSGAPRRALSAIQPIINAAQASGRLKTWAEAVCIKASALHAENETPSALRALLDCIEKCAPLGLKRTFVDRAVLLRPLGQALAAYVSSQQHALPQDADSVLQTMLAAMKIKPKGDVIGGIAPSSLAAESLTSRELSLLSLAAQGLPNADIAARLVIKLPTVKTHFHNIFAKLDVRNRTAAISKARAQGLLE